MKIGIILTPDIRSKAYLQKIIQNHIVMDTIIFMNNKRIEKKYEPEIILAGIKHGFDISTPVKDTLENSNFEYKELNFVDINHPELVEFVKQSKTDVFIFTGGGILKNKILNVGPKFVHLHPGIVPYYRGSTCFYYSIINENQCGVTAYFMDEKLDTGDIIFQKIFEKPNHIFVDEIYDPTIRSETLVEVLQKDLLNNTSSKKQDPNKGETYFIIHPVLKHIAILSCVK